jgi:glycosyltransferase involved in cell wall biosynthesis
VRIAVVADDLYPGFGGQASATEGHIEALHALGHEILVMAADEKNPSLPPPGVKLERAFAWQPGNLQTTFVMPDTKKLATMLENTDVLQINLPTPFGFVAMQMAKARNIPVVVGFMTQEESSTTHFQPPISNLMGGVLRLWYSFFYNQADAMTVLNPFSANLALRYTKKPRPVVSAGIRFADIRNVDTEEAKHRRASWLGDKKYLLSYVGRLAPEKRPTGMLEVMAALKKIRQDVRLCIAGRGPLFETMQAQSQALGLEDSVKFLGFVSEEEKRLLMRACDVFVMPSPTELQSIVTLEAMAQESAIFYAQIDTSAVGELVENAQCGIGYNLKQPEQAAQKLSECLNNQVQLEQYQQNALACAKTHDLLDSGRALEKIYQTLAAVKNLK